MNDVLCMLRHWLIEMLSIVGSLCWDSPTYEMAFDKFNSVMTASFGANFCTLLPPQFS